jgi:hypothetical protein
MSVLEPRDSVPAPSPHVLVYRLYGHYSFNARDGGEVAKLVVSDGYSVGEWFNGGKLIIGRRVAMSVEQAIHHGFARIVK